MTTPDYRAELENIVNARRFDRDIFFDDTEFADWAQNRARALLAAPEAVEVADEPTLQEQALALLDPELDGQPLTRKDADLIRRALQQAGEGVE